MTTLYGIKNCDTIKKARKQLEQNGVAFTFHDYRVDGLDASWLRDVAGKTGWEVLLNTRGTTYRQLSDEQKADMNEDKALALMMEFPAMIKRPVLVHNDTITVGFKANQYDEILS